MALALAEDLSGLPEPDRILSAREFRAFQLDRPDHEHWELVAGRPIMMSPVFVVHNRIASNLERLLNDALEAHDPSRIALQRIGVELGSDDAYRPDPDFAVIDADFELKQRFVDRCYLLGEILSSTDHEKVPGTGRPWIDIKSDIYRAHALCTAVLLVEQERIELRLSRRGPDGWAFETLSGADATLDLPEFGLRCRLGALYLGTPLMPRRTR